MLSPLSIVIGDKEETQSKILKNMIKHTLLRSIKCFYNLTNEEMLLIKL